MSMLLSPKRLDSCELIFHMSQSKKRVEICVRDTLSLLELSGRNASLFGLIPHSQPCDALGGYVHVARNEGMQIMYELYGHLQCSTFVSQRLMGASLVAVNDGSISIEWLLICIKPLNTC